MPPSNHEEDKPIVRLVGESLFEVTISQKNHVQLFSDTVQRLNGTSEEADVIPPEPARMVTRGCVALPPSDPRSYLQCPFQTNMRERPRLRPVRRGVCT
jgi:hypothetical protein